MNKNLDGHIVVGTVVLLWLWPLNNIYILPRKKKSRIDCNRSILGWPDRERSSVAFVGLHFYFILDVRERVTELKGVITRRAEHEIALRNQ